MRRGWRRKRRLGGGEDGWGEGGEWWEGGEWGGGGDRGGSSSSSSD